MKKVVCSRCGGRLVHETFIRCGKVRKVTQAGKLQKAVEYHDYSIDVMSPVVYCIDCRHKEKFNYDDRFDAISLIDEEE